MSFPISITWQVAAPPVASFKSMADSAKNLDAALTASGGKLDQFGSAITHLDGPLGSAGQGMGELSSNMQGLDTSLETSASGMGALATATGEMSGAVEGTSQSVVDLGGAIGEVGISSTDASGGVSELGGAVGEMSSGVEGAVPPVGELNTGLTEATGIFGEAGTASGEFTGALTGLNTENQAVAGGLTENNLLMGDLATSTTETGEKTEGLKGSMGLLATGMGSLVGSGISLFQSFTAIRDSQIKVDLATVKLEKSMTTLGTRMDTLDKTTANMNGNAGLMISGLGEWNAAMDGLNVLIDQGVTSGDKWDAAMKRAQAAQQGLTSATGEGNVVIGQAKTQLDKVSQAADTVDINQRKVTKATEGQSLAWANLIPGLVTFISSAGSVVQVISGSKGIITGIKDFATRLPFLTTSLGGVTGALHLLKLGMVPVVAALGAIAVPVGLAVLALGAFASVVTALRVHIKVFDDMGAAIGHVFPQSVGFLNEFRAAFISTSDAVNSSISYILGGIDALSGGTTKSKQDWDAWVKSTFHASESAFKVGQDIKSVGPPLTSLTGQLVLQKGTFDDYNGNLKDMQGNMIALEGGWKRNAQGAAVVTQRYGEVTVASDTLGGSTGNLVNTSKPYVPLASSMANATQEEKAAMEVAATATGNFSGALDAGIPSMFQAAKAQLEGAAGADTNAVSLDTVTGAANNSTPALQATANATAGVGTTMVETSEGVYTMEQALVTQADALTKQSDEAKKTHVNNLALLELWGVQIPDALKTNESAIAGIVAAYQRKTAAVDEELAGAYETIAANTDLDTVFKILNGTIKMTDAEVIALAKTYGDESQATKDAEAATEAFKDRLKEMADELNKAAEDTRELATAILEGGQAAKDETEARRQQAMALGVYDEMIKLAVGDQQEFLDQTQEEISTLQDLATARGADNAQLITSKAALQAYITTHERLPPTQEEAIDAYTALVVAKQDETFETEKSRQALALYLQEQLGVATATNATAGELEALKTALEGVAGATVTARDAVANWASELIVNQAVEMATRDRLLELAAALGIDVPGGAQQSSQAIQQLIEDATGLGEAFERQREKVISAIDDIAASFSESAGQMEEAFKRVGESIGGDEWKENLSEWEDDLDGTLAGMTVAVEHTFGTAIPDILARFNGDAQSQFEGVRGYLDELKGQIDMSPEAWKTAFGEVESILNDSRLTIKERMAFIEADISGLWDRATPKLLAGAGIMTAEMEAYLGGEFLNRIEAALATKDPTAALLGYFKSLPPATQDQMSLFTSILKRSGGDVEKAITTIVGYLQSKDIAIPESTINALATAFNVPASTIKQRIADMTTDIKGLPPEVKTAADTVGIDISSVGAAGTAARVVWAREILEMSKIVVKFENGIQTSAKTISGAYSNMATNTGSSMISMGNNMLGLAIVIAALVRGSQSAATTVSGSFSNMRNNTASSISTMRTNVTTLGTAITTFANQSASRAASFASSFRSSMSSTASSTNSAAAAVRSLANAINALKSKTITIRTIYERVIRTIYAAQGGSFITDSPQRVGPFKVSEFGQKELITVTPLEGPGGNAIGASGLLNKETARRGRRMLEQNGGGRAGAARTGGTTRVFREQPIIVKVGERTLVDIVNRRLYEESDGLIV